MPTPPRFGTNGFRYELVENWGALPPSVTLRSVAAVAVDSFDRVHVFHRGSPPVVVFERDGTVLRTWGDDELIEAHGMFVDRADNLYLVDRGAHTIERYDRDGTHTLTIGRRGEPAPEFSNRPFNMPQAVAVGASGDIFVADGKKNNAVHRYAFDGTYIQSWGGIGTAPGSFDEPHGIWVNGDEVMVCDRSNGRIQFFTTEGAYLREWNGLNHPDHMYVDGTGNVYLTELLAHAVSIFSPDGKLQARWGGEESRAPGLFTGPHGIWLDSHGDMYVGEVLTGHRIQKFRRLSTVE